MVIAISGKTLLVLKQDPYRYLPHTCSNTHLQVLSHKHPPPHTQQQHTEQLSSLLAANKGSKIVKNANIFVHKKLSAESKLSQ